MADQTPSTNASKTAITTPATIVTPAAITPTTVGNPNNNPTNVITFNVAIQFPVKLTTDNYSSWSRQFISLLKVYRLYDFLLGTRSCPPVDHTPDSPYDVWVRQDQSIQHAIMTSIAESIHPYVASTETANEAWTVLERLYANNSQTRIVALKERLSNLKCEGRAITDYLRTVKELIDRISRAEKTPLSNSTIQVHFLNGLGSEYREFKASIRARDGPPLSFEDLQDRLLAYEESLHPQACSHGAAHSCDNQVSSFISHPSSFSPPLAQSSTHLPSPSKTHVPSRPPTIMDPNPPSSPTHLPCSTSTPAQSLSSQPTAPNSLAASTSPHSNTSATSSDPSSSSPTSLPPPIGPTRTHNMTTRSQNNIFKPRTLFLATKHPLDNSIEPTCVSHALNNPQWRQAMSDEFNALVRQGTWELVPHTGAQNVIGCKWVFRVKRNKDGGIERYKARLVAKGFHQRPGSDYFNTFSPVIKPTTIRTVLSLALNKHWPIRQLDVNNAFLHGTLEEELFMEQPPGFVDSSQPHHVCRLRKSIYGLKQAPRTWYKEFKTFLLRNGFVNSRSDSSLFIFHHQSDWVYFLIYVDDIIVTGSTEKLVESIISLMGATFSIKDLGCLNYFLGVNAIFTNAGLFLSQAQYIRELLAKFGMRDAKPVQSPMSTVSLQLHQGNRLPDAQPYRQVIGSLQYLALTRPDISFAVNKLSQFLHAPSDVHWQAAKRILRYLKGSLFHGLLLRRQPISPLHAFSDSDWAGDKDTYHSTTGYVVFLGSNPISWRACKQKAVARSSTEAEYRALAAASSELVWIKHLLHELGHPVSECPTVYCDNVGATHLSSNPIMHTRMKHIAIDLHFVRELVDNQVLRVSHISTLDQLADGLTKPLSTGRFAQLRCKIGVTDGSSILRGRIKETIGD
ncbi:hypothetical protein SLEP1_g14789 [Rubroshorea leprosula]|uniref:Reverse transcriptase Ty1/copia-type domain-containing protein n=1 Tax=Rubroshorea leprosula TaxID=152421 RepID=A0AAV5IRA8_9ROSI|nr:hypothetical protein SLEP1_g14789 [Rubroshorea leprosula]